MAMNDVTQLITLLKVIMVNPWLLSFFGLFIIGYMLKEYTNLSNKVIPWVLFVIGIIMGISLIQCSKEGAIIGGMMAWIIMGAYEHIKNTTEVYFNYKKNKSTQIYSKGN